MTNPQARHQGRGLPGGEVDTAGDGGPLTLRLGVDLATALPAWLERSGDQPVVTWLDEASGARTELSLSTLTNWTAKLANLLQVELHGQPRPDGDVALRTAGHWAAAVSALAAWRLGRSVVVDPAGPAAVTIASEDTAGPDDLAVGAGMGGTLTGPSPTARSFATEVLAEPDDLDADAPDADAVALLRPGSGPARASRGTLSDAAGTLVSTQGPWLLTSPVDRVPGLLAVAAATLTGARLVVLRQAGGAAPPDPDRLARVITQERVSALLVGPGTDAGAGGGVDLLRLPGW